MTVVKSFRDNLTNCFYMGHTKDDGHFPRLTEGGGIMLFALYLTAIVIVQWVAANE